jgi:uncharacterized protein (TIGR00730 family)
MKSIAIYCASSLGNREVYAKISFETGVFLAKKGLKVVYGGSHLGLMGKVAEGALSVGGEVVGVLPRFMSHKELAYEGLTELIWVDSMHDRKLKMHELSDGIIALPGGYGTMEELFEMLTWAQLGLHSKPIGILNVDGYYDHLIALAEHMAGEGLLKKSHEEALIAEESIELLFEKMITKSPLSSDFDLNLSQT